MDLTDQMDLLSISTSHLRNRFDDMSHPESLNNVDVPSITVCKCFHGKYSVTVTVEEAFDEDHLGNAFVNDHTFSHTVIWNSDDKAKQWLR